MRISDWSSDVCSSDLLHHKLTPGHIADIGRIDVLFVPVDGGYTLNIAEMSEVITQIAAPLVIPMHYFSDTTLERFLARMRDSHAIRSEEHTSELQSLMRISYAVFFLQKTNQK